jgi:hypothetical protein
VTATFQTLCDIDARLSAAGHHPLTPFWRAQAERFYAHPTAKTFVGRVGRGGAKSHTSAKLALNETVFGNWRIPPGERHLWAFVSKSKDEAAQRLLLLESFLRALGVPFDTKGDEIALRDAPRGFRVFACSIGAVSGFRCYGYSADELAKWNVEGVNPSGEVCGSLNAMCVTHQGARRGLISSPFGLTDYHAQRFDRGDTRDQITAYAPSWEANPDGITEQATHDAEPDERVWKREYLAIPQADATNAFDAASVGRAIRTVVGEVCQPICVVDASSGGGDAFTWGICGYVVPAADNLPRWLTKLVPVRINTVLGGKLVIFDSPTERVEEPVRDHLGAQVPNPAWIAASKPVLVFHEIGAFEGRFAGTVAGSDIVAQIARACRPWGIDTVCGDQREAFFLGGEFMRHRMRFRELTWTNATKIEAVTRLRRMFAESTIAIPDRPKLQRELLNYAERITSSGSVTYSARTGHDDEASLCVTAAMAELERLIPGSTLYPPNFRTVVSGR